MLVSCVSDENGCDRWHHLILGRSQQQRRPSSRPRLLFVLSIGITYENRDGIPCAFYDRNTRERRLEAMTGDRSDGGTRPHASIGNLASARESVHSTAYAFQ